MQSLIDKKKYIISFDDVGSGAKSANIVINGLFNQNLRRKNLYNGYKYLFLNSPSSKSKKKSNTKVKKIFVSFGGYDKRELVKFFLHTINSWEKELDNKIHINIFCGKINKKKKKVLEKCLDKLKKDKKILFINLHYESLNFYRMLSKADLAVVSGGLTIFESISYKVPVIGLPQYRHQLINLKKLSSNGAVVIGSNGFALNKNFFLKIFNRIIKFKKIRLKMQKKGKKLIDGKGHQRVIKIINDLLLK